MLRKARGSCRRAAAVVAQPPSRGPTGRPGRGPAPARARIRPGGGSRRSSGGGGPGLAGDRGAGSVRLGRPNGERAAGDSEPAVPLEPLGWMAGGGEQGRGPTRTLPRVQVRSAAGLCPRMPGPGRAVERPGRVRGPAAQGPGAAAEPCRCAGARGRRGAARAPLRRRSHGAAGLRPRMSADSEPYVTCCREDEPGGGRAARALRSGSVQGCRDDGRTARGIGARPLPAACSRGARVRVRVDWTRTWRQPGVSLLRRPRRTGTATLRPLGAAGKLRSQPDL